MLTKLISDPQLGRVGCVIDALDECDDKLRDKLISRIGAYFSANASKKAEIPRRGGLKLILTSRQYESIRIALSRYTPIRLRAEREEKFINLDIDKYITHEVGKLTSLRGYSEALSQDVRTSFLAGADGMFLWVSLMVKLLDKTPKNRVLQSLKRLPKDIDGLYLRILEEIPIDLQETVALILKWVVFALRPLTLEELGVACAIRPHHDSLSSIAIEDLEAIEDNVMFCGPIIKVQDDGTVHLVHQTTNDFLLQHSCSNTLVSVFLPKEQRAHFEVSIICLKYMAFDEFDESPDVLDDPGSLKGVPLAGYVAFNWSRHIHQSEDFGDDLFNSVRGFGP